MRSIGFTIAGLLIAAGAATAQTDPLYLSDGDGHKILVIQGGQIVNSFPAVPSQRAFPIAVLDTIRTTGYNQGETGGEYLLDGTPTGNTYPLMQGNIMSDGTTDGVNYNYGISFTGDVWRYDRNWDNGEFLFGVTPFHAGITYDHTDNTLWLSADRASGIRHYDLSGNLLGSFDTVGNLDWNLALEPSTGTLWVGQAFTPNVLYNYAKDGTLLQTLSVPGMSAASFFSGEFAVPAPGAAALLGLSGLLAARRRR